MSIRRSDYDVTNSLNTTDSTAVNVEVNRIFTQLYPREETGQIDQAFRDTIALYQGRFAGFRGCDTAYHDIQHVLDVTLAMARLVDGYERARIGMEPLGAPLFRLGIVVALFHDAGYLLRLDDAEHKNGGEVTLTHVSRGAHFLREYLPQISMGDVAEIAKLPMISLAAPHQDVESLVVSAGRFRSNTWLVGMTPTYAQIFNQRIARGRAITENDISFGRDVIVLGLVPAARLFPGRDPIGGTVRVGSHEFEVIGIQARRGQLADENLDNRIFLPLPIVTRVLLGGLNTVHMAVRVTSESEIETAQDAMSEILIRRHALPAGYPEDFSTQDQASVLKEAQSATTTFKALTFALGGIALLVGGIGIMNMMLVSVHERTREIGIRKSVGASPRVVQAQFLIEAVVLSTLGGIAGVLAGIGSVYLIGTIAGWQTLIGVPSLVIAFAVALAIGLIFGYYPARRASRLDPIAALRYE